MADHSGAQAGWRSWGGVLLQAAGGRGAAAPGIGANPADRPVRMWLRVWRALGRLHAACCASRGRSDEVPRSHQPRPPFSLPAQIRVQQEHNAGHRELPGRRRQGRRRPPGPPQREGAGAAPMAPGGGYGAMCQPAGRLVVAGGGAKVVAWTSRRCRAPHAPPDPPHRPRAMPCRASGAAAGQRRGRRCS